MISIIIPALNEERYIGRILNALKNQTFRDFEVILVDAHSEDNTRAIAKQYDFVKLVNSKTRNVSYQRDLGVTRASFRRIVFMDADGYMKPLFLEKAMKEIKKRKIIVGACYLYPDSSSLFYKLVFFIFRQWIRFISAVDSPKINGAALFSTKEMHEKIGGFNQKITFTEDYDYGHRASKYCDVKFLRTKMYTSVRRFETEGKLRMALRYLWMGIYITLFGNPKPGTFNYKFGHYKFL
jgi:glycosyltransferase involved in cell wall biosynthesis